MSSYTMKPVDKTFYNIRHKRQTIGSVRKRAVSREWVARIGDLVKYAPTAQQAFYDIVAARNRIDLCGEDDPVKARAALDKRNREIAAQNARVQEIMQPIYDEAARMGLRVYKTRRHRRRIPI